MKFYQMLDAVRYTKTTTAELRETFLIDGLFQPRVITAIYADLDRTVVGSAVPLNKELHLEAYDELKASYFSERRELGVLNIGNTGTVVVGDESFHLENLSCLYVGRGNERISFASVDARNPAEFYLLSYPAHASYPTAMIAKAHISPVDLGAQETCNKRRLYKCIHSDGIKSCQLVMGFTELLPGSVWNTMPPHTHMRRSEVYLYFNLPPNDRVVHLMGPSDQTKHLLIADKQAVISPGWSIHAGVGTSNYTFCWGMAGENQTYADMDPVAIADLK